MTDMSWATVYYPDGSQCTLLISYDAFVESALDLLCPPILILPSTFRPELRSLNIRSGIQINGVAVEQGMVVALCNVLDLLKTGHPYVGMNKQVTLNEQDVYGPVLHVHMEKPATLVYENNRIGYIP